MSERIPCSQYEPSANKCQSGFPLIHAVCWGGLNGCPACGRSDSSPMCMQEDPPSHLMRADGHPMGWPDAQ